MAKPQRIEIPKPIREKVISEYNYKCSICGTDKPQLHHIDENPSNNDPQNLLPLCPNCHLIGRHNSTSHLDPAKLSLFRLYKDPTILLPQFDPLFRRLRFLGDLESIKDFRKMSDSVEELVTFVSALEMGSFYGKRFAEFMRRPSRAGAWGWESKLSRVARDHDEQYQQQLIAVRNEIYKLAIELLRYQPWSSSKEDHNRCLNP